MLVWPSADGGMWAEMILLRPVQAVLPLMAIAFPIMYTVSKHYASARLLTMMHSGNNAAMAMPKSKDADTSSMDSWDSTESDDSGGG